MVIIFLFLIPTTNVYSSNSEHYLYTYDKSIIIGTAEIYDTIHSTFVTIKAVHNIPLLQQVNDTCLPTAMRMMLLSYDINVSQKYLNSCVNYQPNIGTYTDDAYDCLDKLYPMNSEVKYHATYKSITLKDIVIINITEKHAVVVDYIYEDEIHIANPWGVYEIMNKTYFESVFTGELLRVVI